MVKRCVDSSCILDSFETMDDSDSSDDTVTTLSEDIEEDNRYNHPVVTRLDWIKQIVTFLVLLAIIVGLGYGNKLALSLTASHGNVRQLYTHIFSNII